MKHYIIPVFIPHVGCRYQCIFCNQQKITGQHTPVTADQVATIIENRLADITEQRRIEVAFYGGSFTALPHDSQNILLTPANQALKLGRIDAIRLSTRPDCIDEATISNLRDYGVGTIELGVQSLDNNVLKRAARGHDRQAVINAVTLIKAAGIACGLQLMPGLPGEDWVSLLNTVRDAVGLRPDFTRIYPVIVIDGTQLAVQYRQGVYQPLTLNQAVTRSAYMKVVFERNNIPVIRTGLQATEELSRQGVVLAGPYHPAFGELVDAYIFYLLLAGFMERSSASAAHITVRHHPQDSSKVRGLKNSNIQRLKYRYRLAALNLQADGTVNKGSLLVEYEGLCYLLNKNLLISI